MLADIDTWNRAAGRWVNRGAHGVASLGTGNMAGNVRYLFDIKDTHPSGKAAKPLAGKSPMQPLFDPASLAGKA